MGKLARLRAKRKSARRARARFRLTAQETAQVAKHARHREQPGIRDALRKVVVRVKGRIEDTIDRIRHLSREIRKIRESRVPSPKPEHGNGHEWWNLTPAAKQLLAFAVEDYGLVCTSITRDWGTGSHHEEIPTRGFDAAGVRMVEFQRDLRYGRIKGYPLSTLLELFGPDNAACADNGAATTLPEGSPNEELHDNHVHAFVY